MRRSSGGTELGPSLAWSRARHAYVLRVVAFDRPWPIPPAYVINAVLGMRGQLSSTTSSRISTVPATRRGAGRHGDGSLRPGASPGGASFRRDRQALVTAERRVAPDRQ